MSNIVATVKSIIGQVKVTTADGIIKILEVGDKIYDSDVVTAMSGSKAVVTYSDGNEAIIEENTMFLGDDIYNNTLLVDVSTDEVTSNENDVLALLDSENEEGDTALGEDRSIIANQLGSAYYHDRLDSDNEGSNVDTFNIEADTDTDTDTDTETDTYTDRDTDT